MIFLEKLFYLSTPEQYSKVLEDFKTTVITEFGDISDSLFIKNEIIEIDKRIAYFIGRQEKVSQTIQKI